MLGRNEWMVISESEVKEITEILSDFETILKQTGVNVETGITLTTSKEVVQTFYVINGEKKCNYYRKSIVSTWKDLLNEIKADLFGEIRRIVRD